MKKNVTIYDIAKKAGVSTTTVYKAVHNLKGVSLVRKKEILEIAEKMNYKSNTIAQTLARKEIKIGVVFEIDNPFTALMLKGVKFTLTQLQNFKVSGVFSETGIRVDKAHILKQFKRTLFSDVDGIILFPSVPYVEYAEFNDEIARRNIPIITLNNEIPSMHCISTIQYDGELLGRIAGDLMNLCNPQSTSVAFIGNKDVEAQNQTIVGFKNVLESKGALLINAYENHYDDQLGALAVKNMLLNYPDTNGVFVGVSQFKGITDALKTSGLVDRFKIITVDVVDAILQQLNSGIIAATLDRHPFLMGQIAVNTLYNFLTQPFDVCKKICVPPSVLLPSNIASVQAQDSFANYPLFPNYGQQL